MTPDQLDAIRVVAYAVDTYANAVEDIRALLDYCRELEAALVTADKAHVDQGTKLATLKAAVLADPIKTPAYRRRIALLEAALDWVCYQPAWDMVPFPPHLAAILESSRKRINGNSQSDAAGEKA